MDNRPALADEFHGVPEATFATMDGLQAFVDASSDQIDDGINFLAEEITYRSIGDATVTLVDRTGEPAPEVPDRLLRHMVFLRARPGVSTEVLRAGVAERIAPALAAAPQVRKLRRHLFEPVEVTLDHPGVVASKPLDLQYQACLEVVVGAAALRDLAGSGTWVDSAEVLAEVCSAVHVCRVDRTTTTKHDGRITLTGIRGVQVADIIHRLPADSQDTSSVARHVPGRRDRGPRRLSGPSRANGGDHHGRSGPDRHTPLDELLSLRGRLAFVPGGAKGIGPAVGRRFAEVGADVMLADVDTDAVGGGRAGRAPQGERQGARARRPVPCRPRPGRCSLTRRTKRRGSWPSPERIWSASWTPRRARVSRS